MLKNYIQDTSRKTKVHDRTVYSTRVEDIDKEGSIWKITTTTAHASERCYSFVERQWVGVYLISKFQNCHFQI